MASKLDICNIALSNIGCMPIASMNENSESARLMRLNYNRCLEAVLREFPWKFATKAVSLVTAGDDEHIGYEHAYVYPYDCLRLVHVYDERMKRPQEYTVRLSTDRTYKVILTDTPSAVAEYTAILEDTTLFPSTFIEALAYKISYEINNAKTGNAQQTAEMNERYTQALQQAYHDDVMETKKNIEWPNHYEMARR